MVARIYSSGESTVIICCVSKIRKKPKKIAPVKESATSKADDCMNS